MEVLRTMRAMRRLKPDPVPRDLLERVVEAATWAPSASNQQQYSYIGWPAGRFGPVRRRPVADVVH